MNVKPFIKKLSFFFDMHPKIPHNFDDPFEIRELTMHNIDNTTMITLSRLKGYWFEKIACAPNQH